MVRESPTKIKGFKAVGRDSFSRFMAKSQQVKSSYKSSYSREAFSDRHGKTTDGIRQARRDMLQSDMDRIRREEKSNSPLMDHPEDQAMHDNVAAQFAAQMGDTIKLASYEKPDKILTEEEETRLIMFNSFKNEVINLIQ